VLFPSLSFSSCASVHLHQMEGLAKLKNVTRDL